MLDTPKIMQVLSAAGCSIPVGITDEELLACYEAMKQLTTDVDIEIGLLKKSLWNNDIPEFTSALCKLQELLQRCHANMLVADCNYLLEYVEAEKLVIASTMMEKFGAQLSSFSIAFQTANYRIGKMETEHDTLNIMVSPKTAQINSEIPMVLAVDDSPEILTALKGILEKKYRFYAVNSGKAALKFMDLHAPDLYIFDIDMPGMNGFELAQKGGIKEKGKPLIFLTSNADQKNVLAALEVGAIDFIVKPCDETIIQKKIAKILSM